MKKINKLKLTTFSKQELEKKQLKSIVGGNLCDDKCGTVSPTHGSAASDWDAYFYA